MSPDGARVRAAIALGSNLGNRRAHLRAAVRGLARLGEIEAVSAVYETAPVGGPPQGAYLNAVVVLRTGLPAPDLLRECLAIERSRGRQRRERWGPRPLDLDVLLYDAALIDEPGLTVPHPEITRRRFVLAPLLDAWPGAALPDGTPLAGFVAGVTAQSVERLGPLEPERRCRGIVAIAGAAVVAAALVRRRR